MDILWVLISFRPWNGCAFALGFPPGGHQQSGVHLTLQNPSLPGIIIPPGAQSNRHAKASSSSTAWLEETQVETPTVRITPLHRIIQDRLILCAVTNLTLRPYFWRSKNFVCIFENLIKNRKHGSAFLFLDISTITMCKKGALMI